jgi:hypothetical protein
MGDTTAWWCPGLRDSTLSASCNIHSENYHAQSSRIGVSRRLPLLVWRARDIPQSGQVAATLLLKPSFCPTLRGFVSTHGVHFGPRRTFLSLDSPGEWSLYHKPVCQQRTQLIERCLLFRGRMGIRILHVIFNC